MCVSVCNGCDAVMLAEDGIEVVFVFITECKRNFPDIKVGISDHGDCTVHAMLMHQL